MCTTGSDRGSRRTLTSAVLLATCLAWFLFPASSQADVARDPIDDCEPLRACLERIPGVLHPGGGISKREGRLSRRIRSFGPRAIESLLVLLGSSNGELRDFAAYTLRGVEGLGPEHVAPILAASLLERQGGWLPTALARIGTAEAVAGLVLLLRKYPRTGNQIDFAFERLGARAVPALLPLFRETRPPDDPLLEAAGTIFGTLGEDAAPAALPLAQIASDSSRPTAARVAALRTLGKMRSAAAAAQPILLEMAEKQSGSVAEIARVTLRSVGGPGLVNVYAESLAPPDEKFTGRVTEKYADDYYGELLGIARLGERGRDAVPAVVRLLWDTHPNMRVNAARTLGDIGDAEVGPALVRLLREPDWLLVRASAESLGRIGFTSAMRDLEDVAASHWFPPVRAVAAEASRALQGEHTYPEATSDFTSPFFSTTFPVPTPTPCPTSSTHPLAKRAGKRLYSKGSPQQAGLHRVKTTIGTDSEGSNPQQEPPTRAPDFRFRFSTGWLIGSDIGEFGGDLEWVDDEGTTQVIVEDNIKALYEFRNKRIAVVAGLRHLSFNYGHVYELRQLRNGVWVAYWWRRLPGRPLSTWGLPGDELLINTKEGSVILTSNGVLRMDSCPTNAVE